jgi:integrase
MKLVIEAASELRFMGLDLFESPFVRDLTRAMRKRVARIAAARPRPYVPPNDSRTLFQALLVEDPDLAMLHALAWVSSGRPSNVLALSTQNISDVTADGLSILWTEAKTVAARGPYTTFASTRAFPELRDWILARIAEARETQVRSLPLFPELRRRQPRTLARYRSALRAFRPDCDLRALRRGTVIAMAEAGVPEATLLHLTGHASVANLYRYMAFGRYNTEARLALQEHPI